MLSDCKTLVSPSASSAPTSASSLPPGLTGVQNARVSRILKHLSSRGFETPEDLSILTERELVSLDERLRKQEEEDEKDGTAATSPIRQHVEAELNKRRHQEEQSKTGEWPSLRRPVVVKVSKRSTKPLHRGSMFSPSRDHANLDDNNGEKSRQLWSVYVVGYLSKCRSRAFASSDETRQNTRSIFGAWQRRFFELPSAPCRYLRYYRDRDAFQSTAKDPKPDCVIDLSRVRDVKLQKDGITIDLVLEGGGVYTLRAGDGGQSDASRWFAALKSRQEWLRRGGRLGLKNRKTEKEESVSKTIDHKTSDSDQDDDGDDNNDCVVVDPYVDSMTDAERAALRELKRRLGVLGSTHKDAKCEKPRRPPPLDREIADIRLERGQDGSLGLTLNDDLVVRAVTPHAKGLGVKVGHQIVSVDGRPTGSKADLFRQCKGSTPFNVQVVHRRQSAAFRKGEGILAEGGGGKNAKSGGSGNTTPIAGSTPVPSPVDEATALKTAFESAAAHMRSNSDLTLSNDQKSSVYGLFKQSTEGPIRSSRPGFFDPVGRAKWDGWKKYEALSKNDATKRYVEFVRSVSPSWKPPLLSASPLPSSISLDTSSPATSTKTTDNSPSDARSDKKKRQKVPRDPIGRLDLTDDGRLLKYIRARSVDVDRAESFIRKSMEFREAFSSDRILSKEFKLHPILREYAPGGTASWAVDLEGAPIRYERIGQFDANILKFVPDWRHFILYEIYKAETMECAMRACSTFSRPQRGVVVVQDLNGIGLAHCSRTLLALVKIVAFLLDQYYPENLKRAIVINAPRIFSWLWSIVKKFIAPETREKIQIVGGDPMPVLTKYIDPANIPAYINGGQRRDKDGDPSCAAWGIHKGGKIPDPLPSGLRAEVDAFEKSEGPLLRAMPRDWKGWFESKVG
eukprot:g3530.t1